MKQIFISYPRDNSTGQEVARELFSQLKQREIPAFFDEGGIPFGDRWLNVLKQAVADSQVMLWVISEASQDRKWQEREFNEAERLGLRIIPVLSADVTIPLQVNDQQAVFLFGDKKTAQLSDLLAFLEAELGVDRIKPLIKDALNAKHTEAYEHAIAKWQEVLSIDPENKRAPSELKILNELQSQHAQGKSLLTSLVGRMAEIESVFMPVAAILNEAGKHPQASQILEYTQDFLKQTLSANEYTGLCQALLEKPKTAVNNGSATNYKAFAKRVIAGDVVLFVGSELAREYENEAPTESDFIKQLAKRADFEGFQGSFSSIAEYYRLNKDYGETLLLEELRGSLATECESPNLYRLLAQIDRPLILVSSAYDDALERSFDKAGKRYVELTSLVQRCDGHDIGHMVVRYSDKAEPEVYQPIEEEISRFRWFEEGRSLIFKIRGTCGDGKVEHDYQRESLTLAESDYFTFARFAEKMIPAYLAKHFKNKGFLFVGFSPKSWEERLLVNALLARREKVYAKEPPYTVGTANDPLEAAYWMSQHVQQHDMDMLKLDEYLEEALL